MISDPTWRERWHQDLVITCLVPTIKYFHHALDVKVDEIAIFASASETFSQKVSHIQHLTKFEVQVRTLSECSLFLESELWDKRVN